jgi:hypothetical protein
MNKQSSKQAKKQVSIETMLYRIAELNPSISIVVLTYFSIVVLNCCRTVVLKCRFISVKKQRIKVVNH